MLFRSQGPALAAAWHLARPHERPSAINLPLPAGAADRNAIPIYDFPNQRVVNHYVHEMPVRTSALRSLGAYANVFAIESFMDELAQAAEIDAIAFRLRHLKDPRAGRSSTRQRDAPGGVPGNPSKDAATASDSPNTRILALTAQRSPK